MAYFFKKKILFFCTSRLGLRLWKSWITTIHLSIFILILLGKRKNYDGGIDESPGIPVTRGDLTELCLLQIVLERLSSTALLRAKILQAAAYDTLSRDMKIEVDARLSLVYNISFMPFCRYVQLDVQERKGRWKWIFPQNKKYCF